MRISPILSFQDALSIWFAKVLIERVIQEKKTALNRELEPFARELNFTGKDIGDPDWVINSRRDIENLKKKYRAAQKQEIKRGIAGDIKLIQQKILHHKYKF